MENISRYNTLKCLFDYYEPPFIGLSERRLPSMRSVSPICSRTGARAPRSWSAGSYASKAWSRKKKLWGYPQTWTHWPWWRISVPPVSLRWTATQSNRAEEKVSGRITAPAKRAVLQYINFYKTERRWRFGVLFLYSHKIFDILTQI